MLCQRIITAPLLWNTELLNTELPNTELPNTELSNTELSNTELSNVEILQDTGCDSVCNFVDFGWVPEAGGIFAACNKAGFY